MTLKPLNQRLQKILKPQQGNSAFPLIVGIAGATIIGLFIYEANKPASQGTSEAEANSVVVTETSVASQGENAALASDDTTANTEEPVSADTRSSDAAAADGDATADAASTETASTEAAAETSATVTTPETATAETATAETASAAAETVAEPVTAELPAEAAPVDSAASAISDQEYATVSTADANLQTAIEKDMSATQASVAPESEAVATSTPDADSSAPEASADVAAAEAPAAEATPDTATPDTATSTAPEAGTEQLAEADAATQPPVAPPAPPAPTSESVAMAERAKQHAEMMNKLSQRAMRGEITPQQMMNTMQAQAREEMNRDRQRLRTNGNEAAATGLDQASQQIQAMPTDSPALARAKAVAQRNAQSVARAIAEMMAMAPPPPHMAHNVPAMPHAPQMPSMPAMPMNQGYGPAMNGNMAGNNVPAEPMIPAPGPAWTGVPNFQVQPNWQPGPYSNNQYPAPMYYSPAYYGWHW